MVVLFYTFGVAGDACVVNNQSRATIGYVRVVFVATHNWVMASLQTKDIYNLS